MSQDLFYNVDGKIFDLDRIPHDALIDLQRKCVRQSEESHPSQIKEWVKRVNQIQAQLNKRADAAEPRSNDPLLNGEYLRSLDGKSGNQLRFTRSKLINTKYTAEREMKLQMVQDRINAVNLSSLVLH